MEINSEKSGIMRILNRKGKSKGIKNKLDIPEVLSYPYLGIIINQSLRLKEHEQKLRSFEKLMNLKINMIGRILKKTRSKRILFKTLIKSKLSYGISPSSSMMKSFV